ncbi:TPA: hypothetical protein L6A81_35100 [Pseudomonas aeruginosa]|nr:hypothetical protein [Pseudomonas aeruginosa]
MTPKLLLLATIAYAISLGLFFGWRRGLKNFIFWSFMGSALIEVGATQWGFNRGFSDTLLKHMLIILGLGAPIYAAARHASFWADACRSKARTQQPRQSAAKFAIHLTPLLNLALPGGGIIITGATFLYARSKAKKLVPQITDSVRFQAGWSLMLLIAYILSAMPVGIYMSAVVIFLGIARIITGTVVISRGCEFRYYQTLGKRTFNFKRIFDGKTLTKSNKGL